jgi:hypothetical protein
VSDLQHSHYSSSRNRQESSSLVQLQHVPIAHQSVWAKYDAIVSQLTYQASG